LRPTLTEVINEFYTGRILLAALTVAHHDNIC